MNRHSISLDELQSLRRSFLLTDEETAESNASGAEHSVHSLDHQRVVFELVKLAEDRGWQTKDELGYSLKTDLYINFDFFRSRIIYCDVVLSLRDDAEAEMLKILESDRNRRYAIQVNLESQPDSRYVEMDFLANGKAYCLKHEVVAPDSPPQTPRG